MSKLQTIDEILGEGFYPEEVSSGIKCVSRKQAAEAIDFAVGMALDQLEERLWDSLVFDGGSVQSEWLMKMKKQIKSELQNK